MVNDFLVEYFPSIVDFNFTARGENFDKIAEGKAQGMNRSPSFMTCFTPNWRYPRCVPSIRRVKGFGTDPKTGRQVSVKLTLRPHGSGGTQDEEEKPLFAVAKTQSIETITLEETLKLFELPRTVGEFRKRK